MDLAVYVFSKHFLLAKKELRRSWLKLQICPSQNSFIQELNLDSKYNFNPLYIIYNMSHSGTVHGKNDCFHV